MNPHRNLDDASELARRIKAAYNYGQLNRPAVAKLWGKSESYVARCVAQPPTAIPTDHEIATLAGAVDLPLAWFYADLDRLSEIAGPPTATATPPEGSEALAAWLRQLRERATRRSREAAEPQDSRPAEDPR